MSLLDAGLSPGFERVRHKHARDQFGRQSPILEDVWQCGQEPRPDAELRPEGSFSGADGHADGTDRIRVTDGRGVNAMPTWARDGRVYFVSDRAGAESIWSAATKPGRSVEPTGASAMADVPDPFEAAPAAPVPVNVVPPADASSQAHAE